MKEVPVRTAFVAPPSTASDAARVTLPAAPWERAERVMVVDDHPTPKPRQKPPAASTKGKPKGVYRR